MRLILSLVLTIPLLAQSPDSERPTIQALLTEVRLLRAAIERSTILDTRMQIALQRIQMQESRATRLSQDLDRVRKEISDLQSEQSSLVDRMKHDEEKAAQAGDNANRQNIESQLKQFKLFMERATLLEQQKRARESELAIQAQNEQGRLTEMHDRVNQMERALDEALQQLSKP